MPPDFDRHIQKWQLEEKQLADASATTTELVTGLIPNTDDAQQIQQALSSAQSADSLLGRARQAVRRDMTQDGAEKAVYANFRRQEATLAEAIEQIEGLQDTLKAARTMLQNRPDPPNQTDAVLQQAKQSLEDIRNTPSPSRPQEGGESILGEGYLEEQNIGPVHPTKVTDYTIQQVAPRYYTVQQGKPRQVAGQQISPDWKIVDEEGESIQQVDGYEHVSVTDDGQVIAQGDSQGLAQHKQETWQISPRTQRPNRPTGAPQPTGGARKAFEQAAGRLKDDQQEAYWACGLLELIGKVKQVVESLRQKLDQILRELRQIPRQLLNGQTLFRLFDRQMADRTQWLKDVEAGVAAIETSYDANRQAALGFGNQLVAALNEGQSANTVCQKKHEAYCQVHNAITQMWQEVKQSVPAKLALKDKATSPIKNWEPEAALDAIDAQLDNVEQEFGRLDQAAQTLERDICHWVEQGVGGLPKSLQTALSVATATAKLLKMVDLPTDQMAQDLSTNIDDWVDKLKAGGLTEAADKLAQGDIDGFMGLDAQEATTPGKVAEDIAELAKQQADARKAARMRQLEDVARVRHEQNTVGQSIRDGMRTRLKSDTNQKEAELIEQEVKRLTS